MDIRGDRASATSLFALAVLLIVAAVAMGRDSNGQVLSQPYYGIGAVWSAQPGVTVEYWPTTELLARAQVGYGMSMWLVDAMLGYRFAGIGSASLLGGIDAGLLRGSAEGIGFGGPVIGGSALIYIRILNRVALTIGAGGRYVFFSVAQYHSFRGFMPSYTVGLTLAF